VLSERDLERRRRREAQLSARRARELARRRLAVRTGAGGFVLAAVLPVLLWRDTVTRIAAAFEPSATYFITGWSPWVLMALGLLCSIPALVRLRPTRARFYGPGPGAWAGWGVTLYLLGSALATQVAQLADGISRL
jgi:hypothetical protein